MKKKMRAILSLVLAFVLTIGSVNVAGLFTKSMDKVNAEGLTEISWEDLGATYGTTYVAGNYGWETSLTAPSLKDLNNKKFVGDVILADNTSILYSASDHCYGLYIKVENGVFKVTQCSETLPVTKTLAESDATKFGLKSFIDTRFTLEIQTTEWTESRADVAVFINGYSVGSVTINRKDGGADEWKLGTRTFVHSGSVQTLKATPELTEISWTDFGAKYGKTYTAGSNGWDTTFQASSLTDLNNTKFKDDVILADNTTLLYGGSNWCYGLCIKVENGTFKVTHYNEDTFTSTPASLEVTQENASKYGLESFINTRFTIELRTTEWTEDIQAVVDVLINGYYLGTITIARVVNGAPSWTLGTMISVPEGSVQTLKATPELKEISWEDFENIVLGNAITNNDTWYGYKGENLNGTKFVGDVSIPSGSGFRYAVPSTWFGLTFKESDGNLLIGGTSYVSVNGESGTLFTCKPGDYSLDTFTNTRFTVCIELYALDDENLNAVANIYINGKEVGKDLALQGTVTGEPTTILGKGIGFANQGLETGIIPYKTKPTFREITWKNFGLTDATTLSQDGTYEYVDGSTLNNTAFTGDISIPIGGGFRYAVPTSWHGFTFKVSNDGQLIIEGSGGVFKVNDKADNSYQLNAADYGLQETFANKRFTVRIEFYELAEDNLSARVNIYINGRTVGEDILLSGSDSHPAYKLANNIGVCQNGIEKGCTVYEASEIKPELTKLTWSDFGFSNCTVYTSNGQYNDKHHGHANVNDLNNTEFSGKIIFSDNSSIRYGGSSWVSGLQIAVEDGTFKILGADDSISVVSEEYSVSAENASTYGLTSFSGEEFELKICMTEMTEEQATVSVYINDVQVGSEFTVSTGNKDVAVYLLGNNFYISVAEGGSITIPNTVAIPTDLTSLSWEEFGYTGGITTTESVTRPASHLDNLSGTLFSGDVTMPSGSQIRYAENADTEDTEAGGVSVTVNADGTLTASVVKNGEAVKSYNVNGAYYGVDTFINTKFNLKIAVMTDNQIGVWVNNSIVGDLFKTEAKELSLGTTLCMAHTGIIPISSRTTAPTDLTKISFDDWTETGNPRISEDGKLDDLETCGPNANLENLIGTSLFAVMNYQDTNKTVGGHTLVYGGTNVGDWYGIRIFLDQDGKMQLTSDVEVDEKWISHGKFTVDPQLAGIGNSFRNTEFSLKIDTVRVGNNILLYMSFNGKLYNNAPFVFYDFADLISNVIYYVSYEHSDPDVRKENRLNCYIKLGSETKTLETYYHDLEKGDYTPHEGTTKFYKKSPKGEWTEISTPSTIKEKGDYKVEFNDDSSGYIQEVVCYKYQEDVDVTVLVRALRMKAKQTDKNWFEYEKRLCDKDYDGKVDDDDVKTIKKMLLGTYNKETEMRISGFYSPTPSLIKDETYATIKSTGVNHIIETGMAYTDDPISRYRIYQELSFAQKYGMTVTVQDGRLTAIGESNGKTTSDAVKEYAKYYANYQSFDSIFIFDEPKSKDYPNTTKWRDEVHHRIEHYANVAQAINEAGYKGWSNAFGGNADFFYNKYNSDAKCYMKYGYYSYLGTLVDTYKLDFLSFTYYPFWDEETNESGKPKQSGVKDAQNYFTNLAMVKDIANNRGIPFRTFVQAGEGFEYEPNDNFTEAQFKWNANINLAFGTSALEYFPLVHPASLNNYSDGSCASGLLDSNGGLTKFGEWATSVNKQATAVDEVLLNATNVGYMSTGGYAKSVATNTVKSVSMKTGSNHSETITNEIMSTYNGATVDSSDKTYGAFTGCFTDIRGEYAGKSAMYIVNYNDTAANDITVNFGVAKEVTIIYQGVKTTQTVSTYNKNVAAGDAVLVIY